MDINTIKNDIYFNCGDSQISIDTMHWYVSEHVHGYSYHKHIRKTPADVLALANIIASEHKNICSELATQLPQPIAEEIVPEIYHYYEFLIRLRW